MKKVFQNAPYLTFALMISLLVIITSFQNCSPADFSTDDVSRDDRLEVIDLNTTSSTEIVDHKLVIIFDNSRSMSDELSKVMQALDRYFDNLEGQANFDVVVYTTDSGNTIRTQQSVINKNMVYLKRECFDDNQNPILCSSGYKKLLDTYVLAPPAAFIQFNKNLSPAQYDQRKSQLLAQLQSLIPDQDLPVNEVGLCSIIRSINAQKANSSVYKLSPNDFVSYLVISDENDSSDIFNCTNGSETLVVGTVDIFTTKMSVKALRAIYTAHGTADGGSASLANIDTNIICDSSKMNSICFTPYTASGSCSDTLKTYLKNNIGISSLETITSITNCSFQYVTLDNHPGISISRSSLANTSQNICLGGSFTFTSTYGGATYNSINDYVKVTYPSATNITCQITPGNTTQSTVLHYDGYSETAPLKNSIKNNLNNYFGANKYGVSAIIYNAPSNPSCPINVGSEGVKYKEFIDILNPDLAKTFSICLSNYDPIFNHIQNTIVSISSRTYPVNLEQNEIMVSAYIRRSGRNIQLTQDQYSFSYDPSATVTIADGVLLPGDQILVRIRRGQP